ncbi:lipopolysaccharide biosynthesis protein [Raoultibacter phocaeensis]|uniref:lipopolysaccharide biosynthesis protein n=1 Tax=Raoultibacter phocaeensis TaxID=2479841 RepID=UPI0021084B91|nr:lipopolysaccharide biosynthesis protein [Raoultibacter phocaeensis]
MVNRHLPDPNNPNMRTRKLGKGASAEREHASAALRGERPQRTTGDGDGRTERTAETIGRHERATPAQQAGRTHSEPTAQDSSETKTFGPSGRAVRGKKQKKRKPNFVTRSVNNWCNRLLGAVSDRTLAEQEEEYAAHRTTRDFVWNTIGVGAWGMVFPVLTIVVTQLVGVEQAGMFSLAFVTGLMLMFVANYGVRAYQVSDINEEHSFSDYQINRILTCIIMVVAGVAYCSLRGYTDQMLLISMGVYLYKMIDGLADVYEGRLQQVDKLYLAGISQGFRSVVVVIVFSIVLFVSRNLEAACISMAIASAATFLFLTFPLALFETPKSRKWSFGSVFDLLKQCFPLFVALFMYNLIDNMPKFVMEGVLSYDNQLYFNALYFPAHAILLTSGFIYKPLLLRMANVWADPAKRKRFDLIIVVILASIVVMTLAMVLIMGSIGLPIMSFLYGIDFAPFRELCFIMLAAGGVTAAIEFVYQVITVLRRQKAVMKLYLITFGFSLFIPILLINFTGLPGAVIGYLIVMCILFVLLIWEYFRIRYEMSRQTAAEKAEAGAHNARDAAREKRRAREDAEFSSYGSHAARARSRTSTRESSERSGNHTKE